MASILHRLVKDRNADIRSPRLESELRTKVNFGHGRFYRIYLELGKKAEVEDRACERFVQQRLDH